MNQFEELLCGGKQGKSRIDNLLDIVRDARI